MTGVGILTAQFDGTANPALSLVVEIAWGADITADDSTWTWTEVTTDVQLDPGVSMTLGRADEASTPQPAVCSFDLDNSAGAYSQTALSANWPNVKRGTPVRVRTILDTTSSTRFEGFAVGFTPGFDTSAKVATTVVSAAGAYRRLGQGDTPLQSVMRTSIPTVSDLVAYWSMEDGTTATSVASGLPGGQSMAVVSGTPQFATNTAYTSSSPLPVLKDGYLLVNLAPVVTSSIIQVTFLADFPEAASASADGTTIVSIGTSGTITRWDLTYQTGGGLQLRGYDSSGLQFTTPTIGFNVDGSVLRVQLQLAQDGADIDTQISTLVVGAAGAGYSTHTATGQTITGCTALAFNPHGDQTNLAVGHAYIQTVVSDVFDLQRQLNAFDNEQAGTRFTRLCGQTGTPADTVGSLVTGMGQQAIGTFLNLIQECATANFGVIYDGLSAGLTFFDRVEQENLAASLTIDASAGHLMPPFAPVDDDQRLTNQWTVTQKNGSSAVGQDTDGPLGTDVVGLYDNSLTVNLHSSSPLQLLADWLVHEYTVEGYRYPLVALEFNQSPSLLASWLDSGLLSRIDITNIAEVADQMPDRDIRLLVQGYTEVIGQFVWSLAANTSSYDPWRLATVAEETGDTDEFLMRLDTDGAAVHTDAAVGATSISVETPSGPLWTTAADDFPLFVEIGGIRVTVTAITGSSSPQTFTVTGSTVTKVLPAGTDVSVWDETVLSI
ncbi:MAG TPA: hypothetical protein VFX16_21115 [Pseudonocardiaceae bacterium]|nr:hypothetical protein [Pseudonocardiaceae bacterium]